jgi:hypothetical protein
MQPQRITESTKLEKTITVGGRSHRIANDHHALLAELHDQFRYVSLEELLFLTSLIGARLALSMPLVTLFNGENRRGAR